MRDLQASGLTAVGVTLSVGSTGDRIAKAIRRIAVLDEKIVAAPDLLMRIRRAADLNNVKETQGLGVIFNVQDTSLLENDLTRVAMLRPLGLRVMQMTYNTRNLVGDGCLECAGGGLSNLGRELVACARTMKNESRRELPLPASRPKCISSSSSTTIHVVFIPTGLSNRQAIAALEPALKVGTPSNLQNLSHAVELDAQFWVQHNEQLTQRFNRWLEQR